MKFVSRSDALSRVVFAGVGSANAFRVLSDSES